MTDIFKRFSCGKRQETLNRLIMSVSFGIPNKKNHVSEFCNGVSFWAWLDYNTKVKI